MSIHTARRLGTALAAAAAALFTQIGSAAAASPQIDFQEQVRGVLTGSIAAIPHSDPDPANGVRSNSGAQQFAQQLLLGWSVSHLGRTQASRQTLQAKASESTQRPQSDEDFQSTVQEVLLGAHASSRGAL